MAPASRLAEAPRGASTPVSSAARYTRSHSRRCGRTARPARRQAPPAPARRQPPAQDRPAGWPCPTQGRAVRPPGSTANSARLTGTPQGMGDGDLAADGGQRGEQRAEDHPPDAAVGGGVHGQSLLERHCICHQYTVMGGCASTGGCPAVFPQFPKIMTPPLFLGITSFFIVASPIVYSQKYLDFWEFPKFMTHPIFGKSLTFSSLQTSIVRSQKYLDFWEFPKFMTHPIFGNYLTFQRCNVNSSFPKIVGFLEFPKFMTPPLFLGITSVFIGCNVNSSFPKILGFLGMNLYFWETKRKKD